MCNAYTLRAHLTLLGEELRRHARMRVLLPPGGAAEGFNFPIPQSVFPRRDGLILRPIDAGAPEEGCEPVIAHWNLTPAFHKGAARGWLERTHNCRSETMFTAPAFEEASKRRRCLIPASSIVEWTGPTGAKTKHEISRADGGLLFLAGLWDRCMVNGRPFESYTMVMMRAARADFVGRFRDRQPVFLDAEGAATWLDLTADPTPVLSSPPLGTLTAQPAQPVAA
jgi:putative SOS response-associated peptidase YedK